MKLALDPTSISTFLLPYLTLLIFLRWIDYRHLSTI